MEATTRPAVRRAAVVLLASLPLGACGAVRSVAAAPEKMSQAVFAGEEAPKLRPLTELHHTVLRLGDFAGLKLQAATNEFAAGVGTPQARIQAASWRLDGSRNAFNAATGPVPLESLIDLVLFALNGRMAMEREVAPEAWGEAAQPMLAAFAELELRLWRTAAEFCTQDQVAKLRAVATAWEQSQKGVEREFGEPLPTVAEVVGALQVDEGTKSGLLGFMQLDPLSGLEPAAREVALSRQFAERTLFWAQRLQVLVEAEVELAVLRAQRMPEVVGLLSDVARVSGAADSLAQTAAALPERLRVESEAALGKLSAEVTAQREGLVRDLESSRAPLEALLAESRQTFQAAQGMSVEVAEALRTLDAFVGRFDRPEDGAAAEPREPRKPFDVSEYGAAAARVGEAAAELRQLVTTLDTSMPEVERLVGTAAARGDELVDRAFRRGLELGLALVAAAALAVLGVRFATARLARASA